MAEALVKIYLEGRRRSRKLVQEVIVHDGSAKRITANWVKRMIAREFAPVDSVTLLLVKRIDDHYQTSRSYDNNTWEVFEVYKI